MRRNNPLGTHRIGDQRFSWICDLQQADHAAREQAARLMRPNWLGGMEGGHGKVSVSVLTEHAEEAVRVLSADLVLRGCQVVWNPAQTTNP